MGKSAEKGSRALKSAHYQYKAKMSSPMKIEVGKMDDAD